MNTWEGVSQDPKQRRVSMFGETHCSSKDAVLTKTFGSFSKPDSGLYVALINTLFQIHNNPSLKTQVCAKARAYMESFLKYETVLTAQVFRAFLHGLHLCQSISKLAAWIS